MTETTMRAPGLLRAVFVVHGLITLAGAVVLTVFPTAIPSAVGITAGAAGLSARLPRRRGGTRRRGAVVRRDPADRPGRAAAHRDDVRRPARVQRHPRLVYMAVTEVNGTIIANTVARFAVVAVFLVVWRAARPHHT